MAVRSDAREVTPDPECDEQTIYDHEPCGEVIAHEPANRSCRREYLVELEDILLDGVCRLHEDQGEKGVSSERCHEITCSKDAVSVDSIEPEPDRYENRRAHSLTISLRRREVKLPGSRERRRLEKRVTAPKHPRTLDSSIRSNQDFHPHPAFEPLLPGPFWILWFFIDRQHRRNIEGLEPVVPGLARYRGSPATPNE